MHRHHSYHDICADQERRSAQPDSSVVSCLHLTPCPPPLICPCSHNQDEDCRPSTAHAQHLTQPCSLLCKLGEAHLLDDGLDLRLKTHVQHAVGFIQDQVGDASQRGDAGFQHVYEAARGCDHNLDTILQILALRTFWGASIHACVLDAR